MIKEQHFDIDKSKSSRSKLQKQSKTESANEESKDESSKSSHDSSNDNDSEDGDIVEEKEETNHAKFVKKQHIDKLSKRFSQGPNMLMA